MPSLFLCPQVSNCLSWVGTVTYMSPERIKVRGAAGLWGLLSVATGGERTTTLTCLILTTSLSPPPHCHAPNSLASLLPPWPLAQGDSYSFDSNL